MKEHTYKNFDLERDWMGVDFDGTLHIRDKSAPLTELGQPVPEMVERVKGWLARGMKVRIFTARVSLTQRNMSVEEAFAFVEKQHEVLKAWCKEHIGQELPITCSKDCYTYQMYDDRAVAIERNTGKILGINDEW